MNITSINQGAPGAFANGFGYFCTDCGHFFSVQIEDDCIGQAEYCPYCGEGGLITTVDDLLGHCRIHDADPVNFYSAFPFDEPIPLSNTGATPKQVRNIIGMVIAGKKERRPVTIDAIAAGGDIPLEIVARVFDELHIITQGAANE